MSIATGIAAIKQSANSGFTGKKRPRFFKLNGGESRMVRFLQELDPAAEHADDEAGYGAAVVEYRHPDNFRLRALDTSAPEDGGKCWMAEQGWNPRRSLYILVEEVDGPNAGQVRILNQGFGKSTISNTLLEMAEEYGTIRDRPYKITRQGTQFNDTSYTLLPLKEDDPAVIADVLDRHRDELVDWEEILNRVEYDKQEAYFTQGEGSDGEEASAGVAATPVSW